jgi:hypothetical protein
MSRLRVAVGFAFLGVSAALPLACASVDPDARNSIECPTDDPALFRPVSQVLELRCGTLDCHGHPARPLRLYGQYGLRRPEAEGSENVQNYAEYFPGGKEPTTDAELQDNIRSLCGLEPETMTRVVRGENEPGDLTLTRKARLEEKHKGGRIWFKGTEGDRCLVSWLDGTIAAVGTGACEDELTRNR